MGTFTSTKQFRLGVNLINPWWLSGASIDLDLDNGRYYDSSLSALKQPLAVVTDYLSCSRASIGYAKTSAGMLTQVAANALRLTDLGLLVEDARTNLASQSQAFDISPWGVDGLDAPTANAAVAPDSTTTMDLLSDGTATQRHVCFQNIGTLASQTTTNSISIFAKDVDRRFLLLSAKPNLDGTVIFAIFDLQSGVISQAATVQNSASGTTSGAAKIEAFANNTYRISIEGFIPGGTAVAANYFTACLLNAGTSGGNGEPPYTGSNKSLYVWGAQWENAAFSSSYIPTTTTSATRAADNIIVTGTAQTLIAAGTASIVAQVNNEGTSGVAANLVDSNGTNLLGFDSSNHGLASITATLATSNTANRTSRDKVGLAWSGAGRSLVLNGGTVATDASAQTPSSTQHVGSSGLANFVNGIYERLTVWNTKLADATLQALTAP